MKKHRLPDRGALSDEQQRARAVNERLLDAVDRGDARETLLALEEGASDWLSSDAARSEDENVNPVLKAILSPHGPACLTVLDNWLGDVGEWAFGRWQAIHWAVAQRSEWAVEWCVTRGHGLASRESVEGPGLARSALVLATQMGDLAWLKRVLEIHEKGGESRRKLAHREARAAHGPTAIGVALFEMGQGALAQAAGGAAAGEWEQCARFLAQEGFHVDSRSAGRASRGAKLACVVALKKEAGQNFEPLQAAALLGAHFSFTEAVEHGEDLAARHGVFGLAGGDLDIDWRDALLACGLREGPEHGCWGVGASSALRVALLDGGHDAPRSRSALRQAGPQLARVARVMDESFAAAGVDKKERPLTGLDAEFARWAASQESEKILSADSVRSLSAPLGVWRERVELAEAAGSAQRANRIEAPSGGKRAPISRRI